MRGAGSDFLEIMKKIILIILWLACTGNLFPQQTLSEMLDCNKQGIERLRPSKNAISQRFHSEVEKQNQKGVHSKALARMANLDIDSLRSIPLIMVSFDTINNKLTCQIDTAELALWKNDGYILPWDINRTKNRGVFNYGYNWNSYYKNVIDGLPKIVCFSFVYFIKKTIYLYRVIAYKNLSGNIIIVDRKTGSQYNSLEEIIPVIYGSFDNFIKRYYQNEFLQKYPGIDRRLFSGSSQ